MNFVLEHGRPSVLCQCETATALLQGRLEFLDPLRRVDRVPTLSEGFTKKSKSTIGSKPLHHREDDPLLALSQLVDHYFFFEEMCEQIEIVFVRSVETVRVFLGHHEQFLGSTKTTIKSALRRVLFVPLVLKDLLKIDAIRVRIFSPFPSNTSPRFRFFSGFLFRHVVPLLDFNVPADHCDRHCYISFFDAEFPPT